MTRSRTLKVAVLHPSLGIGSYLGRNTIEWGYSDLYPNYQVIGLSHEVLHALTESKAASATNNEMWALHSMIYLGANEELRKRINGYGRYFDKKIVVHYDIRLVRTARAMLPYWQKYVCGGGNNIFQLFRRIRRFKPKLMRTASRLGH
jgi:hypothetical protein